MNNVNIILYNYYTNNVFLHNFVKSNGVKFWAYNRRKCDIFLLYLSALIHDMEIGE